MSKIRLIIAEDATLVRQLLAHQLHAETDIQVVGEASNGRETVELAASLRPDVIIMDLLMPVLNGAQATEKIIAQQPNVKVILLTAHGDLISIGRASGAFECLNKGCTRQELVAAVRRGYAAKLASIAAGPAANSDHQIAIERLANRVGLSDREKTVVEKVVTTEFTIQQIAYNLSKEWKTSVSDSSVKHALERAMNKIGIEPRTRYALVKHVLQFEDNIGQERGAA